MSSAARAEQWPDHDHWPITGGEGVLRALKTSEIVARDIVHDIVAKGLRPGDALPPEHAMLDLYGVGRESLREGLRLLEVQGLVTIRRGAGGGPIVGSVDPANLGRTASLYYHLAGATYRELIESWVLAESLLAERAARNPDAELRARVMEPYLMGGGADDSDIGQFVANNVRFHAALASLARNRVLEITLQTMGQIVSRHHATEDDPRVLRASIERDHYLTARAVVIGHARRARMLMERHLETVAEQYRARLGDALDDFVEWR